MNDYTVELTGNIEIMVSANNTAEATKEAQKEAATMNREILGTEPVLLDCSIPC